MKKITSIFTSLVMLVSLLTAVPAYAESDVWGDAEVATAYAGGTGTTSDPYQIANAAQLRYANDQINSDADEAAKSYKLVADIDFANGNWVPMGWNLPNAFTGTFDGADHVISNVNLTIAADGTTSYYAGFFGKCDGATVKNLGLDNLTVSISNHEVDNVRYSYIGGMAGGAKSSSFARCFVKNSVVENTGRWTKEKELGAFVGRVEGTSSAKSVFTNCYVYNTEICGAIQAQQAGFVGHIYDANATFTNCYAAKITNGAETNVATTYGFGMSESAYITKSNCYSTMIDAIGGYSSPAAYTASKSFGETGMTKDALVSAMVETGAYKASARENDGYPSLGFNSFDGVTPATSYANGSGSGDDADSAILIENAAQLLRASQRVSAGDDAGRYFKLIADIDYKGYQWLPFGQNSTHPFGGTFDGNGHVIKNLVISNTSTEGTIYNYTGFFGHLSGATVKNLGIDNLTISAYNRSSSERALGLGGFAGYVSGAASISNCFVKNSSVKNLGRLTAEWYGAAGFVGLADGTSSFTNCYVYNTKLCCALGTRMVGFVGGVGKDSSVKFNNCFAAQVTPDYTGASNTAGATTYGFGYTYGSGTPSEVNNCYSTLTTAKGSGGGAEALNTAKEFGTAGATLANITSIPGFVTGAGINGNYPYLAFEAPAAAPDYMVKSVKKDLANNGKLVVDITKNASDDATVYVAGYTGDGRLVAAESATVNTADFSFPTTIDLSSATTIKVFVWDDNNSPVANAYSALTVADGQISEL